MFGTSVTAEPYFSGSMFRMRSLPAITFWAQAKLFPRFLSRSARVGRGRTRGGAAHARRGLAEPRGARCPPRAPAVQRVTGCRASGAARPAPAAALGRARAPRAPGGDVGLRQLGKGPGGGAGTERASPRVPHRPLHPPGVPPRHELGRPPPQSVRWTPPGGGRGPAPPAAASPPKGVSSSSVHKSCSWQRGCIALAATRTAAGGEQHIAAQPNLLITETHSACGKHTWDVKLICRKHNVPVLYLCPRYC